MKNKILEARLKLNIPAYDIADICNISPATVCHIEAGTYRVPHTYTAMMYKLCEVYCMSIEDFFNSMKENYMYRQNNDTEFLQELKNRPRFRRIQTDKPINRSYSIDTANATAKKLFEESINLGFYNTADRTAYNKYGREHNTNISVDEWHIIKKKLETEFINTHGTTPSNYKFIQSLTRSARKVGFGDDYLKYNRWIKYIARCKGNNINPMPIEEWSIQDDIKMHNRELNKKSDKEKKKCIEYMYNLDTKLAIELGFNDVKQYRRWRSFKQFNGSSTLTIEEWKEIDKVRMERLNDLRNRQESIIV